MSVISTSLEREVPDLWDLSVHELQLISRAEAWRSTRGVVQRVHSDYSQSARRLQGSWQCARASSYAAHVDRVLPRLEDSMRALDDTVRELEEYADSVARTTRTLGASWNRVLRTHRVLLRSGETVTLAPMAIADGDAVGAGGTDLEDELALARRLGAELDAQSEELGQRFRGWARVWQDVVAQFAGQGLDGTPDWDVPRGEVTGVQMTSLGGTTVISMGADHHDVVIARDPTTGETLVRITGADGRTTGHRVAGGERLVVNTGAGRDHVQMADDVTGASVVSAERDPSDEPEISAPVTISEG